ncbi:hypothetical protein [Clostridium sp. AM49-4BH]|uniref:hypothetical protein n=1 Tax=Clostridium sp. AM49-4BH TaxID=2293035 RepID=UPI000E513FF3|nr:hypothetical protein [Clostridium sp. AM49-4BH]RHQ14309.1 hypothetical protein DW981_03295 [Clostridium sp. AM49-4BH]
MAKAYEELELKDDFMFSVIMRDPKYVKPFLETILRIKIAKIEYPEVQKNIDIAAGAKGIRLNVYVEDENRCSEDTALTLNDGIVKIILNTKGTLDDVSPEMKRLLDYVDGKGVSDTFTRDLEEAVQSARQNEKWRLDYMTLQQEYRERFQEGKAEGIKEGKIEGKIETLYEELHMTVVEIAEKLAISEEEVQKIVDAL